MKPSILVVGAGPAGLAAATAAARAGASVVLCEERSVPGGQLCYRAQPISAGPDALPERPQELAARLVTDAVAAGVDLRVGALASGWFAGNEVLIVENGRSWRASPDALIVATGSTDLPYPFAGATYPGVFTARGVQILTNQHRVRPGRRFAVIGGGEMAEEVAVDVMLSGGEVVWSGIAPAPFLRAVGPSGVTGIVVGQETYDVDVIAIAVGRQADPALAVMAGTPLAFSAELGGLVPALDGDLRSPAGNLYAAGDAAGIGSVAAAIAEGHLAGKAAAASMGLATGHDVEAARAAGGPELAHRLAARASLQPVFTQPFE